MGNLTYLKSQTQCGYAIPENYKRYKCLRWVKSLVINNQVYWNSPLWIFQRLYCLFQYWLCKLEVELRFKMLPFQHTLMWLSILIVQTKNLACKTIRYHKYDLSYENVQICAKCIYLKLIFAHFLCTAITKVHWKGYKVQYCIIHFNFYFHCAIK